MDTSEGGKVFINNDQSKFVAQFSVRPLYLPNADVINSGTARGLFCWAFALAGAAFDAGKTA